ncbi:MAG: flavoprotein [Propionibacteriaceae bacterium]|nr:flavoprotein [Propionibacteriaceae bacterium]MDO5066897.1 flavoprotein [Propionibacteriaceae bacterium]
MSGTAASRENRRPYVLVLFSGALLGFEDALESLRRLTQQGWPLDWNQTPAASRILDQEAIASVGMTAAGPELVRSHEALVIPTMTVNLAAKVANGIGDCLASNVMAEFIMTNKPVIASVSGVCPDAPEKRSWFPDMPEGYATMLRTTLGRLASFGVHLAPAKSLDKALNRAFETEAGAGAEYRGQVLTAAAVAGFPTGTTVQLAAGTRVTALARDAARERGITLRQT